MTDKVEQIPDPVREQAADWMFRLQAAPGDAALRQRLAAWIAESESHARAWAIAEKTWRVSGHAQPAFAHEWAHASRPRKTRRINAETIAGLWRQQAAGARFWRSRRIAVAAFGVIACLAVTAIVPDIQLSLAADHVTDTGEAREVRLEDGSVVHLGAASAIATSFDTQIREVTLLRGEAFFEVATDRTRAFSVEADELTITVTGTAFNVGLTDRHVSVAVARGSVHVSRIGRPDDVELRPGEGLSLDRSTGAQVRSAIPVEFVAAWRSGRLVVQDVPLADVAAAIGRYYHGVILISDARLKNSPVTGIYDLNDPVRALRALAASYGGVVRQVTPYLVVVSAG
jgi:transmembrane sensor